MSEWGSFSYILEFFFFKLLSNEELELELSVSLSLGLVTYICNFSAQEAEEGGLQIQGWHELHSKCQANLEYTERPCTSYFFPLLSQHI